MPRASASPPPRPAPWSLSWRLLLAGLAASVASWLTLGSDVSIPAAIPLSVLFAGLLLVLVAVVRRLREETWTWPGRVESAAHVSLASLAALAGYAAMHTSWFAGKMFFAVLFVVCLGGTLLLLLPSLGRRILVSLLVLYHFGGMVICATSVDPPNSTAPWVTKQLWTWMYRPYLSFLYLTNAYHFYSPDPGPPALLWFAIHYTDGSYTWVKMPERANSPVSMHYQRHLALPEHSFAALPRLPLSAAEYLVVGQSPPERGTWEEIHYRREIASTWEFGPKKLQIPMVQEMELTWQYREPNDLSKKMLASVARRVFRNAPPSRDEYGRIKDNVEVKSVKMYRIVHQILSPYELANGVSPLDKPKHWPYFLGEFDGEGTLLNEKDPFLYWYLPIYVVPTSYPNHGLSTRPGVPAIRAREGTPKNGFLLDSLELHAAGRRRAPALEEKK